MIFSKLYNKLGCKIKLEISATNKVIEIKIPSETVPPKLEAAKIPKPKNKIMAV
jgi:hypothetical protein